MNMEIEIIAAVRPFAREGEFAARCAASKEPRTLESGHGGIPLGAGVSPFFHIRGSVLGRHYRTTTAVLEEA